MNGQQVDHEGNIYIRNISVKGKMTNGIVKEDFGQRLLTLRGQLTQKEFAKKTGVSQGAIVKYEKGRLPQGEEILKILRTTGVSANWLLLGQGEMFVEYSVANDSRGGVAYPVSQNIGLSLEETNAGWTNWKCCTGLRETAICLRGCRLGAGGGHTGVNLAKSEESGWIG